MGEQPNPWNVLPPQVAKSRHRGAKPSRRCELLGKISLLSLESILSVERRPFQLVKQSIERFTHTKRLAPVLVVPYLASAYLAVTARVAYPLPALTAAEPV